VKEECRDVAGSQIIETSFQDLRYGLRQLRRHPGFTTVDILTLTLGVGATTAILSVVERSLAGIKVHWTTGDRRRGYWDEGSGTASPSLRGSDAP
jgi:hypothetical protein